MAWLLGCMIGCIGDDKEVGITRRGDRRLLPQVRLQRRTPSPWLHTARQKYNQTGKGVVACHELNYNDVVKFDT